MSPADRLRFEQQRGYFERAFARLEEVLALNEDEVAAFVRGPGHAALLALRDEMRRR